MIMWRVRSITKQLNNPCMFLLHLSSSSSIKLFNTTCSKSSIKKNPNNSFPLLPLPTTFLLLDCFSSSSGTTTLTSSSQLNSSHGGSFIVPNHNYLRASIPVRAFFLSTRIDLKSLVDEYQVNFIPPTLRVTNHVLLTFFGGSIDSTNAHPWDLQASLNGSGCSYMVVFQYGSVVMFNIGDHEVKEYLKILEKHASDILPEMRKDGEMFHRNEIRYEVREKPNLPMWMQGGLDYIMLQQLNIYGIRMIGTVLSRSVALDYYVPKIDGLVAEFTEANCRLEKTGTCISYLKLLEIDCKVSPNLHDVGLLKSLLRLEIAWQEDAKYSQMWDYLQDKFELTRRFVGLDLKLRLLEIRDSSEGRQVRRDVGSPWIYI